jgi:hypothetical protein
VYSSVLVVGKFCSYSVSNIESNYTYLRTFSDNGTSTQAVYGEIAADPAKRQTFADNVVQFMQQHGRFHFDVVTVFFYLHFQFYEKALV